MRSWKEIAYYEDTTEGILLKKGYSQEFINWIEENNYAAYNGLELWINTKTKELKFFKQLIEMHNYGKEPKEFKDSYPDVEK